ncbi:hypothetical protein PENSPDRAFT_350181, partial [Peniophora sp. CONT]
MGRQQPKLSLFKIPNIRLFPFADARVLTFPTSDGAVSQWPLQTGKVVSKTGCFDFYRKVKPTEPAFVSWLHKSGSSVAELSGDGNVNATFSDLPAGYALFERMTFNGARARRHIVLIGSETGYHFRSVPEFVLHAFWLYHSRVGSCSCR